MIGKRIINTLRTIQASVQTDNKQFSFVPEYGVSMFLTPIQMEIPWMPFSVIYWLRKRLKPSMSVFEYGSGGSTLFFAKYVNNVTSIEHVQEWTDMLNEKLEVKGFTNAKVYCIPRESNKKTDADYEKYARSIQHTEKKYDVIVIDGRARVQCAIHAITHVKKKGIIVLDNSERERYQPIFKQLQKYPKKTFKGMTPHLTTLSQTTIWRIE